MGNDSKKKRHIAMTGATGALGFPALKEITRRLDHFTVSVLARPSKKNKKLLAPFIDKEGIDIVWGDLTAADDVRKLVKGADIVLHIGGMVSPAADYFPEKTIKVNTSAMQNIVDAVRQEPDPDKVGVVYIGSVAEYGPKNPPHHWGRTGDPLNPARHEGYAVSKIAAERILADSGLRKWASLRLSGLLSPQMLLNGTDPITFHVPINGVLEWTTPDDGAQMLANVCEEWVTDEFWCDFYNVGGGEQYRLTNYDFETLLLKTLHCPRPEKVFDARWFATDNFHGMWYSDSDRLDNYLHYRQNIPVKDYFKKLAKTLPWYFSLAAIVPAFLIKGGMRIVAERNELAPLYWKKHNMEWRIDAHFGGRDAWDALPDWKGMDLTPPSSTPEIISHGYDETKPKSELDITDMQAAAAFRGGKCLSENMTPGDMITLLDWEDSEGNQFKASPASVLLGGHWGPYTTKIK